MFKGSIVALITPFKNNKLDEDCYISLIHHHLKSGTSGLVPAGTTGESQAREDSDPTWTLQQDYWSGIGIKGGIRW